MKESDLIFGLFASLDIDEMSYPLLRSFTAVFDISDTNLRSVLSRMSRSGVLAVRRDGRAAYYSLSAASRRLSRRVSLRFHEPDYGAWDHRFFSLAFFHRKADSGVRYQLRRRLLSEGLRPLYPGFWIRPLIPGESAADNLEEWTASGICTWSTGILNPEPDSNTCGRLWKLADISACMNHRLAELADFRQALPDLTSEQAFRMKFTEGDTTVRLLADDPMLPAELLPADWPAPRLRQEFRDLNSELTGMSRTFLERKIEEKE